MISFELKDQGIKRLLAAIHPPVFLAESPRQGIADQSSGKHDACQHTHGKNGIKNGPSDSLTIRLRGIEDADDLIADPEQAIG